MALSIGDVESEGRFGVSDCVVMVLLSILNTFTFVVHIAVSRLLV
jgi:hypothetical protein